MTASTDNGWDQHKKFVEEKLRGHDTQFERLWDKVESLSVKLTRVEVKVGMFVMIATVIASAVATAVAKLLAGM